MKTICQILSSPAFVLLANMQMIQEVVEARRRGSTIQDEFAKRYPWLVPITKYLESVNANAHAGFIAAINYSRFAADGNLAAMEEFRNALVVFTDDFFISRQVDCMRLAGEAYYEKIQGILSYFITKCSAMRNEALGDNPEFSFNRIGLLTGLELIRRASTQRT